MTDVLIAGGGIAGSSLAIMLGRKGFSVDVFERAQFPREKPCGEGLMPGGVAVLNRLKLMEAIGGVPFRGVRYHWRGQSVEGVFPQVAGFPDAGIGQRRRVLDDVLSAAAAGTSGVSVHTGTRVDGPLIRNGRVVGLMVDGKAIRAPLVVAADGMHSCIRRQLGLTRPVRRKRFGVRAHFRLASHEQQSHWVEVFIGRRNEIYVTPLPHGEITVIILAEFSAAEDHSPETFLQRCREFPKLAARLLGAEQVSKPMGASPLSGRSSAGVVPGVVLLGDAAGFLDPATGGGMSQALMTSELLAEFIYTHKLSDAAWLWSFERQRRNLLRDYRLLTQALLWVSNKPRLTSSLMGMLRRWPSLLSHGIGVSGGAKKLFGSI